MLTIWEPDVYYFWDCLTLKWAFTHSCWGDHFFTMNRHRFDNDFPKLLETKEEEGGEFVVFLRYKVIITEINYHYSYEIFRNFILSIKTIEHLKTWEDASQWALWMILFLVMNDFGYNHYAILMDWVFKPTGNELTEMVCPLYSYCVIMR